MPVDLHAAIEESFFLGLRMNRGVSVDELCKKFGSAAILSREKAIDDLTAAGLLEKSGDRIRLTPRGRLLSNEVFERFLTEDTIELPSLDT